MKLIRNYNEEYPGKSADRIELGEGETVLTQSLFIGQGDLYGELTVPEGIEVIEDRAFARLGIRYHTFYFPKSLKSIGERIFYYDDYGPVKVIYAGGSEAFKALATVCKEEVYESDGFDRYPYYSGGSRRVTRYHCFDTSVRWIHVYCTEDGVTLLYGTSYRSDDKEPKVLERE